MNLIFRVLYVLIRSLFCKKIVPPFETSELKLYVLPNDLDTNWHMNNGRYLTIMDLGRLDFILRSGIFKIMVAHKSVPILSAATIRYRLPLNPLELYKLSTKIIYWNEEWFYVEQRFIKAKGNKAGATAAIAMVKGNFYCNDTKSVLPTKDLFKDMGIEDTKSPNMPAHLAKWIESEQEIKNLTKNEKQAAS